MCVRARLLQLMRLQPVAAALWQPRSALRAPSTVMQAGVPRTRQTGGAVALATKGCKTKKRTMTLSIFIEDKQMAHRDYM